ncbi:MAG: glycosyltransferase [Rhodocyclaceae bacterium]|nr:glycosyltransferase [Rhodocyclaceae bacterium]
MFLSFLPPFGMRQQEAPYLWVLYKQITHLRPDEIAFVGTSDYFRDPATFDLARRWDIAPQAQEYAGFTIPLAEELATYRRFLISDEFLGAWRQSGMTSQEIMRRMLCVRLPELENQLRPIIRERLESDRLEAIFSWCNVPSLSTVASEFGLPVIHNELGALRGPCYRATAYFDFRGVNGGTEAADRYAQFKTITDSEPLPLLSKYQILDLMLVNAENTITAAAPDTVIGVALQIEDDTNIVAFSSGWDSLRLLEETRHTFGADNVRVRHHPGGLQTYPESYGAIDHSPSSIEFILRCQTVATINSSVGLEAMLLDRDTRILGDSPCAIALPAERRTLTPKDKTKAISETMRLEELRALNFLVFAYLIPFEFLFDPMYLRWRLGSPSESDIYRFHLAYWQLRRQQADEGLRFHEVRSQLEQRGLLNEALLNEIRLRNKTRLLAEQVSAANTRANAYETYSQRMSDSLSWRITEPLRFIDRMVRQPLRRHRADADNASSGSLSVAIPQASSIRSRPLKIAIVSKADHFGGGASRVAEELTALLNAEGHRADHWLSWRGGESHPSTRTLYGRLSVPIRAANFALRKIGLAEALPFELAILYPGGILDYDLVHFHDLSSAISPLTLRWLSRRKPVVWTIHDCSPFTGGCLYPMECENFKSRCGQCPQLGNWPIDSRFDFTRHQRSVKQRLAASGRIHYITPSAWMAATAASSGMFSNPPEVVHNGVDTTRFHPGEKRDIRIKLDLPLDRTIVLLSAGSLLDERKGVRYAVAALHEVRDLKPFILLVGHSTPQMRELLSGFDIREAGYLGEAGTLARYYAAADLFLFTSLADNQPLSVLETMAAGTPVIGFQTGGIPEIVCQGESGFLVPPKDVKALSACLRSVLGEPAILASWAEKGVRRANELFSHGRFVNNHVALYRRLLASRAGTA